FYMIRPAPRPALFPYTPLFRSPGPARPRRRPRLPVRRRTDRSREAAGMVLSCQRAQVEDPRAGGNEGAPWPEHLETATPGVSSVQGPAGGGCRLEALETDGRPRSAR